MDSTELPYAERTPADMPGHWLLARLGKRVLRPGGAELSERMLNDLPITGADVLEIAPGLGRTATEILGRDPGSYVGVESDDAAVALTKSIIGDAGEVVEADASATGLPDASVDIAIGEAMLTMQSARGKGTIVAEAHRVLRDGGHYAVHELAIHPDTLPAEDKTELQRALARSIKVNARPLTETEWRELFTANGFEVTQVRFAPMALLQPRRIIADEGIGGALRFIGNVIRDGESRARVLQMRSTFRKYRANLAAIELVVRKRPQSEE
ncbi:methyltransferase domain-containing protein [Gordonia sp. CPCC 205333]|uniref:methyltransferase domain-containing protein n=1 Tax=Gordonia sp. CPCC 205333 TaxID=3140790 RepID=UPI003AF3C57B